MFSGVPSVSKAWILVRVSLADLGEGTTIPTPNSSSNFVLPEVVRAELPSPEDICANSLGARLRGIFRSSCMLQVEDPTK